MTGFVLRAIGLATILYFIFVLPIGRKTVAQAAREVWEETNLGHAIEVKTMQMRREMNLKMHKWQKSQAIKGDIDADGHIAADPPDDTAQQEQPADFDAPPVPRPKQPAKKAHPKHSRGRPGGPAAPPSDDDHF